MNLEFKRELPAAKVVKEMYPITESAAAVKAKNDAAIRAVLSGESTNSSS